MVRSLLWALVVCCFVTAPVWAQRSGRGEESSRPAGPDPTYKQITVNLTEYSGALSEERLAELASADDLTPLLAELKKANSIKSERNFSMRVMEHVATSAQFGGTVSLPESVQAGFGDRSATRTSYRQSSVGTLLNLQWTSHAKKFIVSVNFNKSRPEPMPDAQPTIETTSISTTVGVEPGTIVLVGSKTSDGLTKFLTISVTPRE